METKQKEIVEQCLIAAYEGTMDFPAIVGALMAAGFESYAVDFRQNQHTYFLPSGESLVLGHAENDAPVAPAFRADLVEKAVREAQTSAPGYTYAGFCAKVKAAGCASYVVSFLGRRVLYLGRTAETHVEFFPI